LTSLSSTEFRRAGWFTALLLLICFIGDGWPEICRGLTHQLLLLPFTALFLFGMQRFLFLRESSSAAPLWTPHRALLLVAFFELAVGALFVYQAHHFAFAGYRLHPVATALFFLPVLAALIWLAIVPVARAVWIFVVSMVAYAGGVLLAVYSFPLTYLRSDMLFVIYLADIKVLQHISPYLTMYVADRAYDFPYLPGMIVAFLPFTLAHLDLRLGTMAYLAVTAGLIYWAARVDRRREVATLLALFLLCPYLQYRHELYLSPHWLTMIAAFVLMQRRHFAWAAFVLGIGMGIYQFSWIILPFVLLHALRRRGWLEAIKLAVLAGVGALLIVGPFLKEASSSIASNTVSQWGTVPHGVATPINLSYWVTYLIHPDKLLRLQAVLMIGLFGYCFFKQRCTTLEDTLRWIVFALAVFILFNVLVDGYFYLMLLVPMVAYTCIANGWWSAPAEPA
jgi:hypothetical protein